MAVVTSPPRHQPHAAAHAHEHLITISSRVPWLTTLVAGLITLGVSVLAQIGADARWLAALGGMVTEAHHVPDGVPYATLPSEGWVNVPVLGELTFHGLEVLAGDPGLVVAQVVAVSLALLVLAQDMRLSGAADTPSALVLLLAAIGAAPALVIVRAQLFSLVLFAVLILLLRAEARRSSWRIWLVVPLVALWSNLHGAVLTGVALIACYLLLDRARRMPWTAFGALVATAVATLITPGLLKTVEYFHAVVRSEAALRGEGLWTPLSFGRPLDVVLVVVAVPLVAAAFLSRPRIWETVAIVSLAAATVHASRVGVWLLFVAATPAARWLTGERIWRTRSGRWVVPATVLVFAGAIALATARSPGAVVAGSSLRDRADQEARGTPILADPLNAEALALDGRRILIGNPLDAFRRGDQALYLDWVAGRPAGHVLLAESRTVLVGDGRGAQRRLAANPDFVEVARDKSAVLYVRR
jgi:hypothetical protein